MLRRFLTSGGRLLAVLALLSLAAAGGQHRLPDLSGNARALAFLQTLGTGEICGTDGLPGEKGRRDCPACILAALIGVEPVAVPPDAAPRASDHGLPRGPDFAARNPSPTPPARGPPTSPEHA